MSEWFALRDEITGRIAVALNAKLKDAEAFRPTEHPDVLDYILRGRAAAASEWTRDNYNPCNRFLRAGAGARRAHLSRRRAC
jgi:hypothetical protein